MFMAMSRNKIIVGLEIGTSKVCAAVCESRLDGTPQLLGVGTASSCGIRKGEIVDAAAATACIKEALADAEKKAGVKIESVFLSVTGSHISGFNSRGCVSFADPKELDDTDREDVMLSALDVEIPRQDLFLHSILQKYRVDGQDSLLNPVVMHGRKLEADFYIVQATGVRIKPAVRCIKDIGLKIEDVIFAGLASAQMMVTPHQKEMGALVLDIGGGTIDFVLYLDGEVHKCGVLPVGGNHVTEDISQRLRVPMALAEQLKIGEGSALLEENGLSQEILLSPEGAFPGGTVSRKILNKIIQLRMRETLESVAGSLSGEFDLSLLSAGIFVTGGTSQLRGLGKLAEKVFDLPVQLSTRTGGSMLDASAENPGFSTVLGLIEYANATIGFDPSKPNPFFGPLLRCVRYRW